MKYNRRNLTLYALNYEASRDFHHLSSLVLYFLTRPRFRVRLFGAVPGGDCERRKLVKVSRIFFFWEQSQFPPGCFQRLFSSVLLDDSIKAFGARVGKRPLFADVQANKEDIAMNEDLMQLEDIEITICDECGERYFERQAGERCSDDSCPGLLIEKRYSNSTKMIPQQWLEGPND